MERLTYDFALGGNHCWQVKGADNLECREVCERQGDDGCKTCPIAKAFDRLAAIEDILKVVFQPGYDVVTIYNPPDEDGLYTMTVTGVISKEEYEAALKARE